ncbi:MAG: glycosyltransferase family 87 protein [Actinomycetota bacterium]
MRRAARSVGGRLLFVVAPAAAIAGYGWVFVGRGPGRSDFWTFWIAGRTVLRGGDPYPALASLPHVADKWFAPFVYPPVTAFLMAPVAVLPFAIAKIVFFVLNLGAFVLALRLLGVRDWRCYTVSVASPPVIETAGIGTISLLLLLCVAALWRYRAHAVRVGLLAAAAMTAKLFLWPLWFWLVRTGRYRAALVGAGAALAAVAASWWAIGWAGLRDYPALLGRMTGLEGPHGYSLYALGRAAGVGNGLAARAVTALGLVALVVALRAFRDDRRALVALLGVALAATPILWPHYLVLLFVPIAFASRSLSRIWFVPVLLWVDGTAWSHGSPLRIAGELVACVLVLGAVVAPAWRPSAIRVIPTEA